MDGEIDLFVENEQTILLLRGEEDEAKREGFLDKLSGNNGKLRKLFSERRKNELGKNT